MISNNTGTAAPLSNACYRRGVTKEYFEEWAWPGMVFAGPGDTNDWRVCDALAWRQALRCAGSSVSAVHCIATCASQEGPPGGRERVKMLFLSIDVCNVGEAWQMLLCIARFAASAPAGCSSDLQEEA